MHEVSTKQVYAICLKQSLSYIHVKPTLADDDADMECTRKAGGRSKLCQVTYSAEFQYTKKPKCEWRDFISVKPVGVTRESSKLEVGRKSRVFHWSKKLKEKWLRQGEAITEIHAN